ncbi:MAG TPA: 30S ribosomal protein S20 [Candidatus Omnitrophota bacterium]|nr:30S ribosomal protein S20 [Candidatus Omnitrophota bacterium]
MPQRKTAIKDVRKNYRNKMRNMDIKTDLKKTEKTFLKSVTDKNKTDALQNLKLLYKKIDKAAKRNILHKNTAARQKSRFMKLVNNLT